MKVIIDDHISTEENPIKVYIQGINDEEFIDAMPKDAAPELCESEDFSDINVSMSDGFTVKLDGASNGTLNVKRKEYDEFVECTSGEFYYESPDVSGDEDEDLLNLDVTDDEDDDLLNGCIDNEYEEVCKEEPRVKNITVEDKKVKCKDSSSSETYNKSLGKIIVYDKLGHINGTELEGAQINLYKLTGINPKPVSTKMTDSCGKVIFSDLEDGNYRVIAIVDKRYFERPEYFRWNEITIDCTNKEDSVIVVNKIRAGLRTK
ncbi:MAG: prealbumin-like fold domain-containing protein [Clostridium sp.]